MLDAVRDRCRAVQDRWLAMPVVKRHIERHGWDERIADCGSPTFAQVRDLIFPGWSGWFTKFLESEGGESCRGTSMQLAPPAVSESGGMEK